MTAKRGNFGGAVGDDGFIYAIGGASFYSPDPSVALKSAERYDEEDDRWHGIPEMNVARNGVGAATDFMGRIYAIGGNDASGNILRTVERFDPKTNTWSFVAPMSTARACAGVTADHLGRIYAIGGAAASGSDLTSFERYDPVTDTWQTLADLPVGTGYGRAAVDVYGRVYIIGGRHTTSYTTDVYRYDLLSNTWSSVAPISTARVAAAAVTGPDGNIYAVSGYYYTPVVERYDVAANTWTIAAAYSPVNYPCGTGAGAVSANGYIYVLEGDRSYATAQTVEKLKVAGPSIPSAKAIGATSLRNRGIGGAGSTVGVLEWGAVQSSCRLFEGRLTVQNWAFATNPYEHATPVAAVLAGNSQEYAGVAPHVSNILSSGISGSLLYYVHQFAQAMITGYHDAFVDLYSFVDLGADAVNISIGPPQDAAHAGDHAWELILDRTVDAYGLSVIVAAGNKDTSLHLPVPAAAFNGITVGGADPASPQAFPERYTRVHDGNSIPGTSDQRCKPDILGPASGVQVPMYYAGSWHLKEQTGGTSVAAPHVTAVVAQLAQIAKEQADPQTWKDPRALKAVLLTSAEKLLGGDADQRPWRHTHEHPLDTDQGAGLLDAKAAYEVYAHGRHSGAWEPVPPAGWDLNDLDGGYLRCYQFAEPLTAGDQVVATLAWNSHVSDAYVRGDLVDLNLELWRTEPARTTKVDWSVSEVDNVEHIAYTVPHGQGGQYDLWVRNDSTSAAETYGIAWRVLRRGIELPGNAAANGDFATGDFAGWRTEGLVAISMVDEGFGDYFVATLTANGAIRQTVKVPHGMRLSFDCGLAFGRLDVFVGSCLVDQIDASMFPVTMYGREPDLPPDLVASNVGQDVELSFVWNGVPGVAVLDNIQVVPEPCTLALLWLGVVGLIHRRLPAACPPSS